MNNEQSNTRFFEVLHLILKNMHEKREGLTYSFIDHFKMYIEKNKKVTNCYVDSIIKILCVIKEEHDKNWHSLSVLSTMLENTTYDSGILLFFSDLLSPEHVEYKQNIELFKTCVGDVYDWAQMLEDYKDYY